VMKLVVMSAEKAPSPATVQLPGPADAIDWSHATPRRFRLVDNELAVGVDMYTCMRMRLQYLHVTMLPGPLVRMFHL
jgi:hypothetical protein